MYALEPHNTTENFGCVALGATISENYRPCMFRELQAIHVQSRDLDHAPTAGSCYVLLIMEIENHGKYFLLT